MNYLLTASLVLLAAWPACVLLVRYSDRYQINRWLMLVGLGSVLALPFLALTSPAPEVTSLVQDTVDYAVQQTTTEALPFTEQSPAATLSENGSVSTSEAAAPASAATTNFAFTWASGYLIGLALMLLLMGVRMLALLTLHLRSRPNGDNRYRLLRPSAKPGQAFTFGSSVYFSIDVPDAPDFDHILAHERVHARQFHSFDILLSEVFLCLFWFHPTAWWLRTKLRANLEYLVDATVAGEGSDRRAYQMALVRQSQVNHGMALALPFSEPTLRSRIARMTGLPHHWAVAAIASVGMVIWLAVAGITMAGTADSLNSTNEEPYVAYFADKLPEEIESFDLYARRIPTVDEYYQLRAILAKIPGAKLYVWQDPGDYNYNMRIDYLGNVPAELDRLPTKTSATHSFRFGLVPDQSPFSHLRDYSIRPTAGKLAPVAERNLVQHPMMDGRLETMRIFSQYFEHSPQDFKQHPLDSNEEIAIKVNGVKMPLRRPQIVNSLGSDDLFYLLDNGKIAYVNWEKEGWYGPSLEGPETPDEKAAKLMQQAGPHLWNATH